MMPKYYQCVTLRTLLVKNAVVSITHTLTFSVAFRTFTDIIGILLVYRQQHSADSLPGPADVSAYFSTISHGVF